MASPPSEPVNMADVAARAAVSLGTVSRALRGLPGVSPATAERIRALADEMGYVVSPDASRLAGGATSRVAVVAPVLDQWYFATMLARLVSVLAAADVDVLIYQVAGKAHRTRFFRDLPSRRKVDAVVMVALPMSSRELERLDLLGVQVVVAGGRIRDYPHVEVDDYRIGRTAMDHLLGLGHRDIALIHTPAEQAVVSPDRDRTLAYRESLRDAGLSVRPDLVAVRPYGYAGGAQAVDDLLAGSASPTAIFAYSDEMACGALARLRERGVDVPGEVSVLGVDDHPSSAVLGLTTVRQDVGVLAELAAGMVLNLLRGEPITEPAVVVPTSLVVRTTTGPGPLSGRRSRRSAPAR